MLNIRCVCCILALVTRLATLIILRRIMPSVDCPAVPYFSTLSHKRHDLLEKKKLLDIRRRWEDNIKMDLEEVGRGCGDWVELAQDMDRWRALVSTVTNLQVP